MKIIHKNTGRALGTKIRRATYLQKLMGLMFAKDFGASDGLFISWRNSVHNCFVRFPIDVIFLDRSNCVVRVIRNFRPWQFSWIYFSARHVLELPAGAVFDAVKEGDALEILD